MCVANSARSQMAEGLARNLLKEKAQVESAGSQPTHVNPFAIKALQELNLDISSHSSKTVDQLPTDFVADLDFVITLCAEEVCPTIISKARKLHWPLPDPAKAQGNEAEKLNQFREVRDELKKRLTDFAASL